MKWILCILCGVAMCIPSKHALHMFQQNRYETGRYKGWMKESVQDLIPSNVLPLGMVLAGLLAGIFHFPVFVFMLILVLMSGYSVAMEKGKTYIKPLVYTGRVKRQIAVLVLLSIVCMVGILAFSRGSFGYALLCAFAWFGPWVLIFPVGWITTPIEKTVQKSYLNDAKRILNDHAGLIKIGITGSYGKTTTKNIMQAMLSEQYNSLMTPASFNTPMGITRTIREMLKPIHEVFVCEMGADHVGDISELMQFVHPSIGVVTSIGPQHLNTFGSQENIIHEKMRMIEELPSDGLGILNYDNAFIRNYKVQNSVKVVSYGIDSEDVDYRAVNIHYTKTGSSFTVVTEEESVELETKLLGKLNILNILSAVACARHLGVSWEVIKRACKTMKQVEHRLELKKINGYRFIDDAFNANPSGSAMALEVLSRMPGKRIIVTPGMIDLGSKQNEINHRFGTLMKGCADIVILVGETQTKPIYEGLQEVGFPMDNVLVVSKVKEAFQYVWNNATPEDTILLENDLPDAFNH